ncbi:acyl carrier protein [Streptomyces sp. NPDC006339]|uniref:acyl carrier protein n=1 Tax=Streptomyces sp. NPDC006339 TaxID=3156755 RepID=UPI0033B8F3C7
MNQSQHTDSGRTAPPAGRSTGTSTGTSAVTPGSRPSADAIEAWVLGFLAEILDVPADDLDPTTPLDELGVDSATTLVLCAGLSEEFALPVRPRDVFDHFTADALARHLTAPQPAGV